MAKFGYVWCGTASPVLCGAVSFCGCTLCNLVVVCADRTGSRRGETWPDRMAILDEIGGGYRWTDRRCSIYVHSVSTVSAFVPSVACEKSVNFVIFGTQIESLNFHHFYICIPSTPVAQNSTHSKCTGKNPSRIATVTGARCTTS